MNGLRAQLNHLRPLQCRRDRAQHGRPDRSTDRGGAFRARTFQWTEVLARLRGNELKLRELRYLLQWDGHYKDWALIAVG